MSFKPSCKENINLKKIRSNTSANSNACITILIVLAFLVIAPEKSQAEPISLKETVLGALKNNLSIAIEEFNAKIKKQSITDSEAQFDPTVGMELATQERTNQTSAAVAAINKNRDQDTNWNLSLKQKLLTGAEYTVNFNNSTNKTNSPNAGLNASYNAELELNVTQPLLKNAGIELNRKDIIIANNDVNISKNGFKEKVIDIISTAETIYWDLVFSIKDLNVKQTSLERARDLERRVKAQADVGTLAPIEILQAQSDVASREQALLSAEDLIQDNQDKLKNALNIPFSSKSGLEDLVPVDSPQFSAKFDIDVESLLSTALKNRPDYIAKKVELENKKIDVKFNENQLYPSLDLVASLGLNGISGKATPITRFSGGTVTSPYGGPYGESLSNMFSTDYYSWKFGLQLSYPLGNRAAESQLTASRLESAQLLMSLKDIENKILVDVREAARQIRTDIKRVQASRVASRLAEEKLSAEEKKFAVGLSTSFNVLTFQEDLAQSQSTENQALIDYNISNIKLRKSLATTLENHSIKLDD
jgi:outer membrane protein